MKKSWKLVAALLLAVSPVATISTNMGNSTNSVVNAAKRPVKKHKRAGKKHKRINHRARALKQFKTALAPYRTVGIAVKPSDPLYKDIIQGIKAWNDTGVYTFKITHKKHIYDNDIQIHTAYMPDDYAAGETGSAIMPDSSKYLTKDENNILSFYPSDITLNTYFCNPITDQQRVTVVVHELGHAIGLNHNKQQSIMNIHIDPNTHNPIDYNFDKPTPYDIAKIKEIYREK